MNFLMPIASIERERLVALTLSIALIDMCMHDALRHIKVVIATKKLTLIPT